MPAHQEKKEKPAWPARSRKRSNASRSGGWCIQRGREREQVEHPFNPEKRHDHARRGRALDSQAAGQRKGARRKEKRPVPGFFTKHPTLFARNTYARIHQQGGKRGKTQSTPKTPTPGGLNTVSFIRKLSRDEYQRQPGERWGSESRRGGGAGGTWLAKRSRIQILAGKDPLFGKNRGTWPRRGTGPDQKQRLPLVQEKSMTT